MKLSATGKFALTSALAAVLLVVKQQPLNQMKNPA
jgi:hypothetical protein